MAKFFTGWELWQKLTFVLALAIVVTVLLGCLKLSYTRWKLRKFAALTEQEKHEQTLQRQMSQRRRPSAEKGTNDVPFGVRALESGVEVEGVWISRGNTPEPGSKATSAASSIAERTPRQDFNNDLEKQDPANHRDRSSSRSSAGKPPNGSVEKTQSNSNRSSMEITVAPLARSRHPPLSYDRYNANPHVSRHSSASGTLEGLEAIHRASTSVRSQHRQSNDDDNESNSTSSNSAGDDEPISASAPNLFPSHDRPKPNRESSKDLEMLNSHRMSQAAETGQLTPRIRKPGPSAGGSDPPTSASVNQLDYFDPQHRARRRPSESSTSPKSARAPKLDALPSAVRRSSLPDVTPFAQFCQTAPTSPHPSPPTNTTTTIPSQATAGASTPSQPPSPRSLKDTAATLDSGPSSPLMPTSTGIPELTLPPPTAPPPPTTSRPSFENDRRRSQIIRGYGSGFEILRPGSLNPSLPSDASTSNNAAANNNTQLPRETDRAVERPREMQRVSGPPVSLSFWGLGRESGREGRRLSRSGEERNRLKKKRRPSVESRESGASTGSWSSTFAG